MLLMYGENKLLFFLICSTLKILLLIVMFFFFFKHLFNIAVTSTHSGYDLIVPA